MKRLVIVGLVGAVLLVGCTPAQDISFTVDRAARILGTHDGLTEVGLTGYVWCTRPSVGIDIGVTITQDNQSRSTSQTLSCRSTEPERFASTVRFSQGFPHVGPATIQVQGSTDEDGGAANNDSEEFRGRLDLT
jgi:hypothetical protein